MDDEDLEVVCRACDGEGQVPQPTAAVIGGVPQTVVSARMCRWCEGSGRRRGLHPPV